MKLKRKSSRLQQSLTNASMCDTSDCDTKFCESSFLLYIEKGLGWLLMTEYLHTDNMSVKCCARDAHGKV
jgi:hypothetical protein